VVVLEARFTLSPPSDAREREQNDLACARGHTSASVMRRVVVEVNGDVVHAQRGARGAALEVGFGAPDADEFAIIASELATNILKYGVKGTLTFVDVVHPERGRGLAVVARDFGPPFRDFAAALEDGCDDTGPIAVEAQFGRHGLGTGLGAVRRFSDRVECVPLADGKDVHAVRYLATRRGKPWRI
jgi:anti-sigma regulatory factor (Ser/Thr protein kinase)